MSLIRRRLLIACAKTSGKFVYTGNGQTSVILFNRGINLGNTTFRIDATGEVFKASEKNSYVFNNQKENYVTIDFDKSITSLNSLFSYCRGLARIEDNVLFGMSKLNDVAYMFSNTVISEIPEKIFESCPIITNFEGCFSYSAIANLPKDKYGYLWNREGVKGNGCFNTTPAATNFSSIIPKEWINF